MDDNVEIVKKKEGRFTITIIRKIGIPSNRCQQVKEKSETPKASLEQVRQVGRFKITIYKII